MKKIYRIVPAIFIAVVVHACATVPLTGRKALNLLPESEMVTLGLNSYNEFMKDNRVSKDRAATSLVRDVGKDIAGAVNEFFTENKIQNQLKGYEWEFNLIENDSVPNAFALPGGKVAVYSGILPFTRDKNGMAVVLSHEIAHAVARHGNERMSQAMLLQMGGMALDEAVKQKPEQTRGIYNAIYGIGAQLGIMLPYSRDHELEADKLGLIFMAMAGYDPESAIPFWERMARSGGPKPPEFMSTHPSDESRIKKIKAAMPAAMKYYKKRK